MAQQATPVRRPFRSRRNHRRGYTLVFFVMMLFGIMAMAALVIDIGFARLTQRQMQVAADGAALEGLRFRDDYPPGYSAPTSLEDARRQQASDIVAWTFDDNFDPSDGDPVNFGAGPLVQFSGGAGDSSLVASQLMEVDPDNPVYEPQLLDGPSMATDNFQVALRRGPTDLPNDAHLYANGTPVPYLFARGSMINRQLVAAGITVRATSNAEARHVLRVGVPSPGDLLGAQGVAIRTNLWSSLPRDDGNSATDESVVITVNGTDIGSLAVLIYCVGQPLTLSTVPASAEGYLPIFHDINGTDLVVGFGLAAVTVESGTEVRVRKLVPESHRGVVALANASARLSDAWDAFGQLNEADQVAILAIHRAYRDPMLPNPFSDPLLAPVSVR